MSNYTKKDSFFAIKYFTNFLYDQYQSENISVLSRMIDYALDNINLIFDSIINLIKREIDLDESKLYCDGTIYEAHNSRNKVITKTNVSKGLRRWTNKLSSNNLSDEEKRISSEKLVKWQKRDTVLSKLDRNSYGLTDFECVLVKDKNGSFIAGYNVQLIEESKYGLIVYTYTSNKVHDVNALRNILDEVLLKFDPKYFILDAGYDAPDIIKKFKDNNVQLVVKTKKDNHTESITNELNFELNEAEDELICPNNKSLKRTNVKSTTKEYDTRFVGKECKGCSLITTCKPRNNIKEIKFNLDEFKNLKELQGYMKTDESKEIYSHRANLCESPHGFMKYYLKGKKFKRNGLIAANTTIKILASAFNLTRLYNIKK